MKKTILRTALLCIISMLLVTCGKIDWDFFRHQNKKDCDLQSYYLTLKDHAPHPFLFEKKYNATGDRITEIKFTLFNLHPVEVPYKLRLTYHGWAIYLVNVDNALDTTMKIYLNPKGRVKKCLGKLGIDYTQFDYDARNRLSNMTYGFGDEIVLSDTCEYDTYGNILSMTRFDYRDGRLGNFYKYDYSKKAKRQFYSDEVSANDDLTLLRYLGFFPELDPVHIRTHVRVGLETGSFLWEKYLVNHQLDAKGRLIRYDIANDINGADISFQAILNWICK
jgi:hypothetical protein